MAVPSGLRLHECADIAVSDEHKCPDIAEPRDDAAHRRPNRPQSDDDSFRHIESGRFAA
ncbi:MAG: hypothetical protein LC793_05885 [Thermomicrobia bacterium]|nr:hypothetical protein [Thermomicrobia bacterium]